jgi:Apea-like HEPN
MKLKTPELREALKNFVREALQCANPDFGELKFERLRVHSGRAFDISNTAADAQNSFVRQAIKKLGPVKGHAKVLDSALWDFVVSIDDDTQLNDNVVLNQALEQIEAKSGSVAEFFRPCPLIRLPDNLDRIEIGRVAIERTDARIQEFQNLNPHFRFEIRDEWSLSVDMHNQDVTVVAKLPPTMWAINLAAADPVRDEEALWLTDVALTILRMTVKRDDLGVMAPTVGKVEPHPFFSHDHQDHSFTLKEGGGAQLGGMAAPNNYWLSNNATDVLQEPFNKAKIDNVFDARPKSVASRFYQGCGWLTRGRRSKDRSDRLLYFFTAIEALLSDSDKYAPVIQTISRHAAVLLTDDNERRQKYASDIKQLYDVRSALVHAGARGAYDIDANSAQQVAELLYLRVWTDIDLSLSHQEFSRLLSKSSYGIALADLLEQTACGDTQ